MATPAATDGRGTRLGPAERRARLGEVVVALRRLRSEGERLAVAVAADQQVNHTDLNALMQVMEGEQSGAPLTPGSLQRLLGLTSGATTSVIDRLEDAGHVRRERDASDRRRVHLRFGAAGSEVGRRYFLPLAAGVGDALEGFSDAELTTVQRFLDQVTGAYAAHTARIDAGELR